MKLIKKVTNKIKNTFFINNTHNINDLLNYLPKVLIYFIFLNFDNFDQ
jgi:hypothetical protein